jgi:hypothetical protein
MAGLECTRCGKEIGYETRYYSADAGQFVHADCEEDAVEAERNERDEPTDCPECARSFGPHYRGPCAH